MISSVKFRASIKSFESNTCEINSKEDKEQSTCQQINDATRLVKSNQSGESLQPQTIVSIGASQWNHSNTQVSMDI